MRNRRFIAPLLMSAMLFGSVDLAFAAKMSSPGKSAEPHSMNCRTDASGGIIGRCAPEELPDIRCQTGLHAVPSPNPLGYRCVGNGY